MNNLLIKYQNNKKLFVILISCFIIALYFIPTIIVFKYSFIFANQTITMQTRYIGWFYYFIDDPNTTAIIAGVITSIFSICSIIFAILSFKNNLFAIGTSIQPILNIILICMTVPQSNHFATKDVIYLLFSIFLICLFICLVLLYIIKPKQHKPTKAERIADLEKQIAELQSKLPCEND